MFIMGTWFLQQIVAEKPDFAADCKIVDFPAATGGKGDAKDYIGTVGDNFYSISSVCKVPDQAFTAITYMLDDTAIPERKACGKVLPINGQSYDDPLNQQVIDIMSNAKYVQLWLNEYPPDEQADLHERASAQLLDGTITPEEYGQQMDEVFAKLR
jgi:raffinose/stachyose/melibiose transport system substrate-binding protein